MGVYKGVLLGLSIICVVCNMWSLIYPFWASMVYIIVCTVLYMAKKCPNCNDFRGNNTTLGYIINGYWYGKQDVGYSPELDKVYVCNNCFGKEFK